MIYMLLWLSSLALLGAGGALIREGFSWFFREQKDLNAWQRMIIGVALILVGIGMIIGGIFINPDFISNILHWLIRQ
jgi:hypothetical protein